MSKWYGKVIYDREGIVHSIEGTKEQCEAFVNGFEKAKEEIQNGLSQGEFNPLEDYWTSVDQLEPKDE